MTAPHRTNQQPACAAVSLAALTAGLPTPWRVDRTALAAEIAAGRRLVILDDDPTGTQTIADLPVLTSWSIADLRWALQQSTSAFFVLTNTRSLSGAEAAQRNRDIARTLLAAAELEGVECVLVSRGDSTLRGHYPLETDVLTEELLRSGIAIDGVVIVPAYIEAGRLTIDSVHWMQTPAGMIPVADSEFAKDASFSYHHSDLREWVQEMTSGRIPAASVATITLTDIREGGPSRVRKILEALSNAQTVVVDALTDDDLQVLASALVGAEAGGKHFLYRTGPSFVRARAGQAAQPPLQGERLRQILDAAGPVTDTGGRRIESRRGVIVVGSHVGLTSRQLDELRRRGQIAEIELDVPTLLDPAQRDEHVRAIGARAVQLLGDPDRTADVVIRTSRALVTGSDAQHSLAIARAVSDALVATVQHIVAAIRPAFVVAKGGITSSDTATAGLSITRAWARGTLLPGIVSLWEPVSGPAQGIPFVVFAGNVGDDQALADVVSTLRER